MITWKNYEEYMVMHADGELTPAQEQELMSFLYEHPELQSELTAFTMTKMIPEAEEIYSHKGALLKPVPPTVALPDEKPKVIALTTWRRYAVAAGVAALLFVSGYSIYTSNDNNGTTTIAATTPKPAYTAPVNTVTTHQPATTPSTPAVATPPREVAVVEEKRHTPVNDKKSTAPKTITPNRTAAYTYAHTDIAQIPTAEAKPLQAEQKNITPSVTNVPALAIQYREDDAEEQTASTFIDKLPVTDTKKDGMKSLASNAAAQYGLVNSIRKEIENTNVTVSIKHKKLIFSF